MPSQYNILFLHETALFSGAENSLLNLALKMDKDRFGAIFALPGDGTFAGKLRSAGFEAADIRFPRIFNISGFLRSVMSVVRCVREKRAAIIHSNSIRTHLYSIAAGRITGIPVVWHERNLVTRELVDPERALRFLPDRIICNSDAIASRFLVRGALPGKVRVVHNGVDTVLFNPKADASKIRDSLGIAGSDLVVGIAGRLGPDKGHETFLKAASLLSGGRYGISGNIKFLVAGSAVFGRDVPREEWLKRLAAELGVEKSVIFLGFRDDMPDIYAAMDIFVLASRAEPCGRVILEAMALGKPVVASDSGGTPEMVVDGVTGLLFRPSDAEALAKQVAALASDPSRAQKMGVEGRNRVEELFTIERNVRAIQDIYAELLDIGR